MMGRPWTEFETAQLYRLADQLMNSADIGRAIGRSSISVYTRALKLGVDVVRRRKRHLPLTGTIETWDEAERLCAFANVPLPLAQLVANTCHRHGLSMKSVRSDSRLGDHLACRAEICIAGRARGYSLEALGRAVNRDHSTVIHALKAHSERLAA